VVPRTFIGAIAVSTLASPVWWVLGMIGATRLFHQYLGNPLCPPPGQARLTR